MGTYTIKYIFKYRFFWFITRVFGWKLQEKGIIEQYALIQKKIVKMEKLCEIFEKILLISMSNYFNSYSNIKY